MLTLRTDRLRERTAVIAAGAQPFDDEPEVVARPPAQLLACQVVDVDAVDAREQRPAAAPVLGLEFRHVRGHDGRRVAAQRVSSSRRNGEVALTM